MQPETAISNWRDWQTTLPCKPEIIGAIAGGLSNRSYLLNAGDSQMVLRINACESHLPGIDREREALVWRAARQAGITPQLLHAGKSYFVSEFIAGGSLADTSSTEAFIDQAISLIRQCHLLDCDVASVDYACRIQRYWDLIEASSARVEASLIQLRPAMLENLHTLLSSQNELVLCHHDPVKANFVGITERLFLIDWEYASKGLAVMDYAALAIEWGVEDQLVLKGSGIQPQALNQAKILYRYLCVLWAAAQN